MMNLWITVHLIIYYLSAFSYAGAKGIRRPNDYDPMIQVLMIKVNRFSTMSFN